MQHGLVDMVITGTDRTTFTGDVANNVFAGNSTGFPEPVSPSATLLADTNAVVRIRHNTVSRNEGAGVLIAGHADL